MRRTPGNGTLLFGLPTRWSRYPRGTFVMSHDGASIPKTIKHFKALALKHFPKEEIFSAESLKEFRKLHNAACTLLDFEYQENAGLMEMFSLFQFLFFKNDNASGADDDSTDSYDDDSENQEVDLKLDILNSCMAPRSNKEDSEDEIDKEEREAVKNAKELIQEEERAKKKAEKKKTQKKRRKERKKKEKQAIKNSNEKSKPKKESEPENEQKIAVEESTSESEEEIDTNSAFVAVIAKKKKNKSLAISSKKENDQHIANLTNGTLVKEDPATRILRGRNIAVRGNQMANSGHFNEAIELFTEAIKLDPNDHRYYGNRSYCYDRIESFDRALRDANKSISLSPDWPKGHFRKGRALSNLKKYAEAEACFKEVLRLDPECDDAVKEQLNLRTIQLVDMGFTESQAEAALEVYGNVSRALEHLLATCPPTASARHDSEIFLSDDDDEIAQYFKTVTRPQPRTLDVKMDPSNPEGHNSLWIGNVQPEVTESTLKSLFSKYGELLSIKPMTERFCAFVNYKNAKSAGMAMKALQGVELYGMSMLIRFPNSKSTTGSKSTTSPTSLKVPKNKIEFPSKECYFWRTTGCIRGEACTFKHVASNKGVDRDKVYYKT